MPFLSVAYFQIVGFFKKKTRMVGMAFNKSVYSACVSLPWKPDGAGGGGEV